MGCQPYRTRCHPSQKGGPDRPFRPVLLAVQPPLFSASRLNVRDVKQKNGQVRDGCMQVFSGEAVILLLVLVDGRRTGVVVDIHVRHCCLSCWCDECDGKGC